MSVQQYIKDTVAEMKHVNWPTKKQAIIYSSLVIGVSLVMAAYLGALDAFFVKMLNIFIS